MNQVGGIYDSEPANKMKGIGFNYLKAKAMSIKSNVFSQQYDS